MTTFPADDQPARPARGRTVRPRYMPPPYQDFASHGRLILRDGSTATIRIADADDREALISFFRALSDESKQLRFFSVSDPADSLMDIMCDATDPGMQLTLLVLRQVEGRVQIIGAGSYIVEQPGQAEFAVAIMDCFQGKGMGTLLLERLSLLAVHHGITHFTATTHSTNVHMLEVFHHSGFAIKEKTDHGYVTVEMSVLPSRASVERSEALDRMFTAASMRPFFSPDAVAVVGASRREGSVGGRILRGVVRGGFHGIIYPINPHADEVCGLRAYPTLREVPGRVDLAVLVVPPREVLPVVDDCAAAGVRAVIVITSGFAEVKGDGERLQQELLGKIREYGMRMIGPNCLGVVNTNPAVRLNASISPVLPPAGPVAISSQSGALGLAILALAGKKNLGLSAFASVGNKADVSGNDLLQTWEVDPQVRVILLYLESFGNPRRFARIARRVSRRKPIIAVKGGRVAPGSSGDAATDALFTQTGVIRVDTLQEMFDLAAAMSEQPLPRGGRVGVITNAGGPAILCTDMCVRNGLAVPRLTEDTQGRLADLLPPTARVANPVDMVESAGPQQFRETVRTVLACGEIDSLIVSYAAMGTVDTGAIAEAIGEGVRLARLEGGADKPVLVNLLPEAGEPVQVRAGEETLPAYAFPEEAATVLGRMNAYAEWRRRPLGVVMEYEDVDADGVRTLCRAALDDRGSGWLTTAETARVLDGFNLPMVESALVQTADEAVAAAGRLGYPVVVKLASHRIVHKAERGGVHVDLRSEAEVRQAYDQVAGIYADEGGASPLEGVLVQRMVHGAVELMIGVTEDKQFGPAITFGLGGMHVELLGDVCFRVTPLTDSDADEMIHGIRGYPLLEGYRGHDPADVEAIRDVLLRLSLLVDEVPEILEMKLSPVMALKPGEGVQVVDARIRVCEPASRRVEV